MKTAPLKAAITQVGVWCLLVVVAALVTLLFSFLGTLSSAVLTGVMMGTIAHRRWHTIPVSLVFPGVVVAFMYLSKMELVGRQRVQLPVVCLAAFWVTYLLTRAMFSAELKKAASRPPAAPEAAPVADGELKLEHLQGQWRCELVRLNGETEVKEIEIVESKLTLHVSDSEGRIRVRTQANVRLETSGSEKDVVVTPP